jgi:hypothetical protein
LTGFLLKKANGKTVFFIFGLEKRKFSPKLGLEKRKFSPKLGLEKIKTVSL